MIFSLCVPIIDYYCCCIFFTQCSINEWKNNTFIGTIKYGSSVPLYTPRACNDANKNGSQSTGSSAYALDISGRSISCVDRLQSDYVHRMNEINEPATDNKNNIDPCGVFTTIRLLGDYTSVCGSALNISVDDELSDVLQTYRSKLTRTTGDHWNRWHDR